MEHDNSGKNPLEDYYDQLSEIQADEKDAREIKLTDKEASKRCYALANEISIMGGKLKSCDQLPKKLYKKIKYEAEGVVGLLTAQNLLHQNVDREGLKKQEQCYKKLVKFLGFVENCFPDFKKKNEKINAYKARLFWLVNIIRAWQVDNKENISDALDTRLNEKLEDAIEKVRQIYLGAQPARCLDADIEGLQELWKKLSSKHKKHNELRKEIFRLKDESGIMVEKLNVVAKNLILGFKERLFDILYANSDLNEKLSELKKFHNDLKEVLSAAAEEDPAFQKRNQEMAHDESRIFDLLKIIRARWVENALTEDDKTAMIEALRLAHKVFSHEGSIGRSSLKGCIQELESIVKATVKGQVYSGKTIEQWAGVVRDHSCLLTTCLSTMFSSSTSIAPMTAGVTSQPQNRNRL